MGAAKNFILGVAIAIIFAFFIGFGIKTFYHEKQWDDFCTDVGARIMNNQAECESAGGRWNAVSPEKPVPELTDNQLLCTKTAGTGDTMALSCTSQETIKSQGYCDVNYECQKEYEAFQSGYTRNLFIIAAIIGLITMIIGGFFLKHESVSPGLMGGGFFTILYGIIRYWQYAGDWLRFTLLGVILAMLIYLAYKRLPFNRS
jgi:hypothetical protein